MPIYEYQCEKCGHEFEREQRITADPIKTCPECKARKVKKLISQTSFVLKGGGWYNDLYSSTKKGEKADGADAKAEGTSDSKESSKEGSKSENKKDSGSSKKAGKNGGKKSSKASKSAA